jgi:hypothetical protein
MPPEIPARTAKRIFQQSEKNSLSGLFGLEYLFQLVEGLDQAAGAGEAVNVPEYLLPLLVLKTLANEAGLELDYFENFHEFSNAGAEAAVAHPRSGYCTI